MPFKGGMHLYVLLGEKAARGCPGALHRLSSILSHRIPKGFHLSSFVLLGGLRAFTELCCFIIASQFAKFLWTYDF
jgi:hypothetical protein